MSDVIHIPCGELAKTRDYSSPSAGSWFTAECKKCDVKQKLSG